MKKERKKERKNYHTDIEIEYFGIDETVMTISGLPFDNVQHYSNLKLNINDFLINLSSGIVFIQKSIRNSKVWFIKKK